MKQVSIPMLEEGQCVTFVNAGDEPVHLQLLGELRPGESYTHHEHLPDIGEWFGLSYSNYLVLQRSILQSMPQDWQHKFVRLLEEIDDRMGEEMSNLMPSNFCVRVLARETDLVHPDCERCEGECTQVIDGDRIDCPDCNGSGKDYEGEMSYETPDVVGFVEDPIPHYNRGRTVIDFETGREARYCAMCKSYQSPNHVHTVTTETP
jgi:hypothetical protein